MMCQTLGHETGLIPKCYVCCTCILGSIPFLYLTRYVCIMDTYLCISYINYEHVRQVPCNHGMSCPQVMDGEDGLQLWR
jgi:hypothetical protein